MWGILVNGQIDEVTHIQGRCAKGAPSLGTILRFPVRLAVFVFGSTLLLSVLFLRIVVARAGAGGEILASSMVDGQRPESAVQRGQGKPLFNELTAEQPH